MNQNEARIIAICGLKGGTAKTTTAIYGAAALHKRGLSVIVIDADSEKSSLNWKLGGLPFPVIEVDIDNLRDQATELKKEGYIVFIDCSPNNREILMLAAMTADQVIVPTSVSTTEVNRLQATLKLLVQIEQTRNIDLVSILLTRWSSNRVLSKEFLDVFEGYPVLAAKVKRRVKYESEFGTMPKFTREYSDVMDEVLNK